MGNCSQAELARSRKLRTAATGRKHAAGDITPVLSSLIEVTSMEEISSNDDILSGYDFGNMADGIGGIDTANGMSIYVNLSHMLAGIQLKDRIRCIDIHIDDTVADLRRKIDINCVDLLPKDTLDKYRIFIDDEECSDNTQMSETYIGMEDEIILKYSQRDMARNYLLSERIDTQPQAAAYAAVQVMRSDRDVDLLEALITLHGFSHINTMVLDTAGVTLLILAVTKSNIPALEYLVTRFSVNPDECCRYGLTAMSYAAQQNDMGSMKTLLRHGGNIKGSAKKSTPLMYAASANHIDIVKYILSIDQSAAHDVNECDDTPLAFSARRRCLGVSKLLLDAGADPNAANIRGNTPLICAAHAGDLQVVKLLVSHGASPKFKNRQGQTPVSIAEAVGNTDVTAFLKNSCEADEPCEMP